METKCESSLNTRYKSNILIQFSVIVSSFAGINGLCFGILEKGQGKMSEILEKFGNFLRGKKWKPCYECNCKSNTL